MIVLIATKAERMTKKPDCRKDAGSRIPEEITWASPLVTHHAPPVRHCLLLLLWRPQAAFLPKVISMVPLTCTVLRNRSYTSSGTIVMASARARHPPFQT